MLKIIIKKILTFLGGLVVFGIGAIVTYADIKALNNGTIGLCVPFFLVALLGLLIMISVFCEDKEKDSEIYNLDVAGKD